MKDSCNDIPMDKLNLSFAGCGFLGIYHVGVASCFREYCPQICKNRVSGASVGALVATAMALDLSLGESTSDILKVAIKARSRALGPFHPTFDVNKIITDALSKALPEDAHEKVNGRLHISVTRVSDGKNCILSQFKSKQDLIQAVLCSCFIPGWSGLVPPKFHGVAYMDGGFSDNLLALDDYSVTVSPFAGESDICPQDNTFNLFQIHLSNTSFAISPGNLYRITRILFPPHPEVMSKMCEQGFNDALKFLQRNNKISCHRCVAIVESKFALSEFDESDVEEEDEEDTENNSDSGYDHFYDDCTECQYRREMCDIQSLPDPVAQAIQEAIDSVNKGLINWIFKHRPVKILSLLTVPVVLPFDITLVVLIKTWRLVPIVKQELKRSLVNLLSFVTKTVNRVGKRKDRVSAKFSCQLAITEFDYGNQLSKSSSFNSLPTHCEKPRLKRKQSVWTIDPSATKASSTSPSFVSATSRFPGARFYSAPPMDQQTASSVRSRIREQKEKRKSYAGKEQSSNANLSRNSTHPRQRRRSMADMLNCNTSERVVQRMNFGFTVDLASDQTSSSRMRKSSRKVQAEGHEEDINQEFISSNDAEHVIHTLRSLNEDDVDPQEIDLDAVEMTNQALNMEKEYLNNFSKDFSDVTENADKFAKIMNVTTNHDALMAFYYLDEKKRVKVTEIFNIPEGMEEAICAGGRTRNTFVDDSQSDRFKMFERDDDCPYSSLESTGSSKDSQDFYCQTKSYHRRRK